MAAKEVPVIHLGLDDAAKEAVLTAYVQRHGIEKVVVISPARFRPSFTVSAEHIEWAEVILYRFYYRLLQEIGSTTLVVLNECLRTQNRNDLTYNCIRNYLNQTPHVLVFQYLPLIDTIEDFMILFDFVTRSRWKRERFSPALTREATIEVADVSPTFRAIPVAIDEKGRAAYAKEKASLLAEVRADPEKDPHLIPRNLLLVSGRAKVVAVPPGARLVGRNNRFKLPSFETYREANGEGARVVFELPHNFVDMADFLAVARQREVDVLVADTKTEAWYMQRFNEWAGRVRNAAATLHG